MSPTLASRKYDTAASRWAGVGPYYAMFPIEFADRVISEYTSAGDYVLDPFAGRGTALFSAAAQGRFGLGVEINPVGWVYSRAKLQTASREEVEDQIRWVGSMASRFRASAQRQPQFFRLCFSGEVLEFLLAARSLLNWRQSKTDWTTMALILVDLHGKWQNSLSNQMRQTKAMSPQYAIKWWQERGLVPPEPDPVDFLLKKVAWRYARGTLETDGSTVYLGDSRVVLGRMAQNSRTRKRRGASLLFTSPPYCGITNYFYDQWIRLWLLGGPTHPHSNAMEGNGKFENRDAYVGMIRSVFEKCKPLLHRKAVIYVRTDMRDFTRKATMEALEAAFPEKNMREARRSRAGFTQTCLFDAKAKIVGEVDIVMW